MNTPYTKRIGYEPHTIIWHARRAVSMSVDDWHDFIQSSRSFSRKREIQFIAWAVYAYTVYSYQRAAPFVYLARSTLAKHAVEISASIERGDAEILAWIDRLEEGLRSDGGNFSSASER